MIAYRDAMARVAAKYPPTIRKPPPSTRLRSRSAADPADKTYADQLKAGAMLERLWKTQPDHPGLPHYIIHSLRRPGAGPARGRRGAALREDRAGGAARAAHAVAHLHAPRLLAGFDRHQHPLGRGRAQGGRASAKSCTRSTTRSMPTCRPRRMRRPASVVETSRVAGDPTRRAPAPRSAAPPPAGVFAAGGHPGALRARARRVGRSGAPRRPAPTRAIALRGCDDLVRARRSAPRAAATSPLREDRRRRAAEADRSR